MKGLELCELYYKQIGEPVFINHFRDIMEYIAIGMAGPGSECFGFDDEISRDHDWGAGFCIWLEESLYRQYSDQINKVYDKLPKGFKGFKPRFITELGRVGAISLENFFACNTGITSPKPTLLEWLYAPSYGLAVCTNGKVFHDPSNVLTKWRESLLQFYPEDIRRKKISSSCFLAGQSGQYNYPRSIKRGDDYASLYALNEFCSHALSLAFLLSKRFEPYYKWKMKAGLLLDEPYRQICENIKHISKIKKDVYNTVDIIEETAIYIAECLVQQNLVNDCGSFLIDYVVPIQQGIINKDIREKPGLY